MTTHAKLNEIYTIADNNETLPQFIINGEDYILEILNCDSLTHAFQIGDSVNIPRNKIVEVYLCKEDPNLSIDEQQNISNYYSNVNPEVITNQIREFQEKLQEYKELMFEIDKILPLKYLTNDLISKTHYNVTKVDGTYIDFSDITEIFNKMMPNKNVQVIIMTNSIGKAIYKIGTKSNISNIDEILRTKYEPNTIVLLREVPKKASIEVKKAIVNFETHRCEIEISMNKINDTTFLVFREVMDGILFLEEIKDVNVVSGRFQIVSVKALQYYEFYNFIMTDPIASRMFIIDEKNTPWCATRRFFSVLFFDPLCTFVDEYLKTTYSYVEFQISASTKIKTCDVLFKTGDSDLKTLALDCFSKIIRKFNETKTKVSDFEYRNFFFVKPLEEIKARTQKLFVAEKKSATSGYSTKCGPKNQPVMLSEEEAQDYSDSGYAVKEFEANGQSWFFTCLNEDNPIPILEIPKGKTISDNIYYACCAASEKKVKITNKISEPTKIATTSAIKGFGKYSIPPVSIIGDFIKDAFLEKDEICNVKLKGTLYITEQNKEFIEDTAITALLLAKDTDFSEGKNITTAIVDRKISETRARLASLPYELYAQELYDVPQEEFVRNINDRNHYVDPYLYYRGLEELFNVNIIVFTSRVDKRQYPSSYEEALEENPTVEIPRCSRYHTRYFRENRDIILLYKNFGSERKMSDVPSCELFCVQYGEKDNNICSFNNSRKNFFRKIVGHYYRCCEPFILRVDQNMDNDDEMAMYTTIQDWNPNSLGFGNVKGQELDIHGKVKLLIYENWNVEITPGIQPLYLKKRKNRAELMNIKDAIKIFKKNAYEVSDDGILIEFKGIKNGLKVLCSNEKIRSINYESVNEINHLKNNVSALLQLINWLWRSEYSENGLIEFEEWFNEKVLIYDNIDVQNPQKSLNNLYLPKFETYEEKLEFCQDKWPCFFNQDGINLTESLALRILNLMNFQDKYTRNLTPDERYGEIPQFITGLLPLEEDYKNYDTMIFTKAEHLKHWFNITTREYTSHISLLNMNVVSTKIYENLSHKINPYFYITDNGKLYLIQNIHSHEESRNSAIEVSKRWQLTKQNLGPYTIGSRENQMQENHVIFKIDNENIPRQFKQMSHKEGEYLCILNYNNGTFAAMLPID